MTEDQTNRLEQLKKQIDNHKSELIDILREVIPMSTPKAKKLGRIIQELDAWQNT